MCMPREKPESRISKRFVVALVSGRLSCFVTKAQFVELPQSAQLLDMLWHLLKTTKVF